ncbi:MAG: hypothetical protein JWP01_3661 [Myxococcales bacterium]|nr:hypothetical protein [Myxococcales bacterium]
MQRRAFAASVVLSVSLALAPHAQADRPATGVPAAPQIVALAPAPGDDARKVIAIGPAGQIFEPDKTGGWVRDSAITISDRVTAVGRAGASVVVRGDGVIFRLAANGWTAIRIAQKGKAQMSSGAGAVAAIGRQIYALDRSASGEPTKLALAPGPVLALGGGKSIVVATERGLFRLEGTRMAPIKRSPRRVNRLIGDRWALVDRGAVDLRSGVTTPWPSGLEILTVAAGPGDGLVAVGSTRTGLELVTVVKTKLERVRLPDEITGAAVGVALDRSARAVVAFHDGRLAVRDRGVWKVVTVREALPAPRPGPPPAASP